MDELYRDQILEHYKHPHNFGSLAEFDLSFEDTNPLCGDELRVELKLDDEGRITDLAFAGRGCAISQASASLLSDEIRGLTPEELLRLDRKVILELLGIEISATRMKCAMLSLKVLKGAALGAAAEWEDSGAEGGVRGSESGL